VVADNNDIISIFDDLSDSVSVDSPSMGFKDDQCYYGFKYSKSNKLIKKEIKEIMESDGVDFKSACKLVNSHVEGVVLGDGNVILKNDYESVNLNVLNKADTWPKYMPKDILRDIINNGIKRPNMALLVDKIVKLMKQFIYFEYEGMYLLYSLYLIASMQYKVFDYFPILHFHADPGSGKTISAKFAEYLCGAFYSVSITTSALKRIISDYSCVMIIDERENIMNEEDNLPLILNGCFSKDSVTCLNVMGNDNAWKPELFYLFCPVILCSISSIDGATSDRALVIEMKKAGTNQVMKKITTKKNDPVWLELRKEIIYFWLVSAKDVKEKYSELQNDNVGNLRNRNKDVWLPILTLAEFVKTDDSDNLFGDINSTIISIMKQSFDNDRIETMFDSKMYQLADYLNKFNDGQTVNATELRREFNSFTNDAGEKFNIGSRKFGIMMSRLGYNINDKSKILGKDNKIYKINHEKNNLYIKHNYPELLEI